jgi:ABC-type phosphate transport system substrate-binding protein
MSRFKLRLLVGAGALAAASALSAAANATVAVNGGGSTLLAPYWVQAVGCWDNDTGNGSYVAKGTPGVVVTPSSPGSCTPTTGTTIGYVAAGSGAGQASAFAHDDPTSLYGTNPNGSGSTVFSATDIKYSLSDNALVDSDVGVYSVGTGQSYTPPGRSTITTPSTYQGLTFGTGGSYPVAKPLYGPLVQFPVSIDPVALSYNPTYKTGFTLQLPSGQTLKLDATAYCKIFTGAITDWGDSYLASINGVTSLKDPSDSTAAPIHPVGRSDSSGTTSIFTRHLAAACDSVLTSNPYTVGATTLPAAVASLFTTASGSGGVASTINSTAGSIGYIGPDYVLPAVTNTGINSFNLPAAQLKNAAGNYESPNSTTATAAFSGISAPSTQSAASDQTQWVQSTAKTAALANPTGTSAYPIVGTTNFIGYTCYASSTTVSSLKAFLTFGGGSKAASILSAAGLSQLPSSWLLAINNTFLSTTAHPTWNLFFATAGSGSANSNCTSVTGG